MDIYKAVVQGIEVLQTPIFIKDFQGRFIYCNNEFNNIFGSDEESLIGKKATGKRFEPVADKFAETDAAIIAGKGPQSYEVQLPLANGQWRCFKIMKSLFESDSLADSKAIVGVICDITDRYFFEQKMNRLDKIKDIVIQINQYIINEEEGPDSVNWLLEKCMEAIPNAKFGAILILDNDGFLRMPTTKGYSDEMVKSFRLKPEDSLVYRDIGRIPKEICIVRDIDKKLKVKSSEMLVIEGETVKTSLVSPIWIDGSFYGFINIDSSKHNVFDKDDIEIMEYMRNQIQTVLSKQKKYKEKLMHMRTDNVTGLINRIYLIEMAQKAISFAKCSGQRISLSIMDIDGMKMINDTLGHAAGDFILKSFAENISSGIREFDIFGRYGGDEFIAVFPGSDKEKTEKKMEKLRNSMESLSLEYENKKLPLNFSFGISEHSVDGESFDELVEIADRVMYKDKKRRKQKRK